MKQARFPAPIGPDHTNEFTLGKTQVRLGQSALEADVLGFHKGAHRLSLQRICATSQRKKGAPSSAVTTPIGSVRPKGAVRVTKSAASRRAPPIIAAGIRARPGCPAVSRRAKIGATRP